MTHWIIAPVILPAILAPFIVLAARYHIGIQRVFSVDGGKTFAAADELVVSEDGEARAAEARDFTHVRWVMQDDLAAGAQGTARFAAVLE